MLYAMTRKSRVSVLLLQNSWRQFTSSSPVQADELKAAFAECLPKEQKRLKAIKEQHGSKELHSVNVGMVLGGMRGITGLLYETSLLDADEGVRFRGYTIPDLQVWKHKQCICQRLLLKLFQLTAEFLPSASRNIFE